MEKIFMNVEDKNVAAVKVYVKSDGIGYADEKYTSALTSDELTNAFIKGAVIVDSTGAMYKPISCKTASNITTLTYTTADTSTATTAKLATVKNKQ